jgi:radical SAM superfamily enzyme YgiQ (UPF0313 family)
MDGRQKAVRWTKGNVIIDSIIVEYHNGLNKRLKLTFFVGTPEGYLELQEQFVKIIEIESNLGKGKILYFLCPITGRRCRKLYKKEKEYNWQCRQAYNDRIYYPLQLCSKSQSYDAKYYAYSQWYDRLSNGKNTARYDGKLTKRHLRRMEINDKQSLMFGLRFTPLAMNLKLRRAYPKELVEELFSLRQLKLL